MLFRPVPAVGWEVQLWEERSGCERGGRSGPVSRPRRQKAGLNPPGRLKDLILAAPLIRLETIPFALDHRRDHPLLSSVVITGQETSGETNNTDRDIGDDLRIPV